MRRKLQWTSILRMLIVREGSPLRFTFGNRQMLINSDALMCTALGQDSRANDKMDWKLRENEKKPHTSSRFFVVVIQFLNYIEYML